MSQICNKCEADMYKKATLNMSNSLFDVFECSACGNEKQICRGVIK